MKRPTHYYLTGASVTACGLASERRTYTLNPLKADCEQCQTAMRGHRRDAATAVRRSLLAMEREGLLPTMEHDALLALKEELVARVMSDMANGHNHGGT